ncbi:hypothetical protein AACH06_29660 [Ideonella sp. DXS29W]|uniref:Lipoprotein n=1 Tax=Ideonella lacteola TaxID=2984193 RepID=A0ABU9BYE3_9BURK
MHSLKNLIVLALGFALLACAKPIPKEKAAYVGEWHGTAMALLITQDGSVAYRRLEGGVNKSIDAPLKEFQGDNFVVGIGPMSTTFVVSVPPHADGDAWKMTVDGVELTKKH